MSLNSDSLFCAIILTLSFHRIAFVSTFAPARSAAFDNANSTSYETAARKPVTRESGTDEIDQEADEEEQGDEEENDDETDEENVDDGDDDNNRKNGHSDDEDDDNHHRHTFNKNEDDGKGGGGGDGANELEEDKNCTCSGSGCLCCINLNLSFIDLGGPGCVKFTYMADNDSVAVNMSYGERLLEIDTLKRTSTESTCMDLFSDLAQMCAKFSNLIRVSKGIKGCLTVEPFLLGVSQTSYHVGCFNMDVQGLQPQIKPAVVITAHHTDSSNRTSETTTDKPEENEEEELAAAISQSAEEGIAWFNNFIASVFGEESNDTNPSPSETIEPLYNRTNTSVKLTR